MARLSSPYKVGRWGWLPVFLFVLIGAFVVIFLKVTDYVACEGQVEPGGIVPLFASSSGKIVLSSISEGTPVEHGDIILEIDGRLERNTLLTLQQELASNRQYLDRLNGKNEILQNRLKLVRNHLEERRILVDNLLASGSLATFDHKKIFLI